MEATPPLVHHPGPSVKALMDGLKITVQTAQSLPREADFDYHVSLLVSRRVVDSVNSRLCALIGLSASACGVAAELRPGEDPDDAFEGLVDATDVAIEAVGDCAPP